MTGVEACNLQQAGQGKVNIGVRLVALCSLLGGGGGVVRALVPVKPLPDPRSDANGRTFTEVGLMKDRVLRVLGVLKGVRRVVGAVRSACVVLVCGAQFRTFGQDLRRWCHPNPRL